MASPQKKSARNAAASVTQGSGAIRGFTRNTTFYVEKIHKIVERNRSRVKHERLIKRKDLTGEYLNDDNRKAREAEKAAEETLRK